MGANLNHSPCYGRSPSNERVYDERPVAKGKRISMVSALTTSGMKAAFNYEGTMTGGVFLYFLQHFLCPLLSAGDYIVLDNASVHKVDDVKQLIEAAGAQVIYLPPYSPELNPIELVWNKMKTSIRKQRARTVEALYGVYAEALESITLSDSKKFIEHAMKFLK
jgi:transposase